jgi:hypothetical protein
MQVEMCPAVKVKLSVELAVTELVDLVAALELAAQHEGLNWNGLPPGCPPVRYSQLAQRLLTLLKQKGLVAK